jgi:hypothetical protein
LQVGKLARRDEDQAVRSAVLAPYAGQGADTFVCLEEFLSYKGHQNNPLMMAAEKHPYAMVLLRGAYVPMPGPDELEDAWACLLRAFLRLRLLPLGAAKVGVDDDGAACFALTGVARSLNAWTSTRWNSWSRIPCLGAKRWTPPSEPTIRRVLQGLDANRLDAHIGQWVARQQLQPGVAEAVDGKSLRRSHDAGERAPHLLRAILHQEAVVVAQMDGEEKTNEIPKLPALLAPLPLEGAVVTADALHTQKETARYLVEEKQADYLFIAKDNQPTLRQDISDLHLESIPPSAHDGR